MAKYFPLLFSIFVPGLGHIIRGGTKSTIKGMLFLLSFFFVIPLSVYASFILFDSILLFFLLGIAILALLSLWIYSIIDAAK